MDHTSFRHLGGNLKALAAAVGIGGIITMGAVTLAHPTGAVGSNSSSRSSSTSAGLTTTAYTAPSTTSHPPSSKHYTHHASSEKSTHQYNYLKQQSRTPRNPVRLSLDPPIGLLAERVD